MSVFWKDTVYYKMAQKRIDIACVLAGTISYFDPPAKVGLVGQVLDAAGEAVLRSPSEHSLEALEKLIASFEAELARWRSTKPEVERTKEVRERLTLVKKLKRRLGKKSS